MGNLAEIRFEIHKPHHTVYVYISTGLASTRLMRIPLLSSGYIGAPKF